VGVDLHDVPFIGGVGEQLLSDGHHITDRRGCQTDTHPVELLGLDVLDSNPLPAAPVNEGSALNLFLLGGVPLSGDLCLELLQAHLAHLFLLLLSGHALNHLLLTIIF
jgi:hypothetical protein